MKRVFPLTMALLSTFTLVSIAPVWAHEGHEGSEMESPSSASGGHEGKLKDALQLTPDQKTKFEAIQQEQHSVMKTIMEKNKELRTKLEGQVKNNAPDAELQATLSDLEVSRKNSMDQMEKFRQQRDAILTPRQRAMAVIKMGEMRHEGMMKRHEMHKEMKGK